MRYVIGCLAIIGLLVVLAVGGCFGLVAYGFSALPEIPAGLTREAVERRYAKSLGSMRAGLVEGRLSVLKSDREVIAIYRVDGLQAKDVYLSDPALAKTGHHLRNGAGIATVKSGGREARCIAYEMKAGGGEYLIILLDTGLGEGPKPSP